jgi:hypothetical protein
MGIWRDGFLYSYGSANGCLEVRRLVLATFAHARTVTAAGGQKYVIRFEIPMKMGSYRSYALLCYRCKKNIITPKVEK